MDGIGEVGQTRGDLAGAILESRVGVNKVKAALNGALVSSLGEGITSQETAFFVAALTFHGEVKKGNPKSDEMRTALLNDAKRLSKVEERAKLSGGVHAGLSFAGVKFDNPLSAGLEEYLKPGITPERLGMLAKEARSAADKIFEEQDNGGKSYLQQYLEIKAEEIKAKEVKI